jgi:hypothetical protein
MAASPQTRSLSLRSQAQPADDTIFLYHLLTAMEVHPTLLCGLIWSDRGDALSWIHRKNHCQGAEGHDRGRLQSRRDVLLIC